jgi:hypothetical protein
VAHRTTRTEGCQAPCVIRATAGGVPARNARMAALGCPHPVVECPRLAASGRMPFSEPAIRSFQYYPKGADLSAVSQAQLDTVARKLNTRPRETLHWKTPAYMLGASVSMTH